MKPETMNPLAEDRLATYEEIRSATSSNYDRTLELCHADGNYCQTESDTRGIIRYSAEEFEFFTYLSEADENLVN